MTAGRDTPVNKRACCKEFLQQALFTCKAGFSLLRFVQIVCQLLQRQTAQE